MDVPDRVLRTVRKYGMVPKGAGVVVALSGGSDSVALTLLLRELENRGELRVAGLAHLNHALRPAAGEDEAFCRQLADELMLPFVTEVVKVRDVARDRRTSIEDAARTVRYQFLDRAAAVLEADFVATGHTVDDQAETFLLRLIRGAGPRGLAGIFPVAGRVVRPLLEVRRDELRAYLAERAQPFREDETNRDRGFPRNRVRHDLIPYIQRELSPGIVSVLAREAAIARVDEDWLWRQAIESADKIVLAREAVLPGDRPLLALDASGLTSLHPAVASRVARHVLTRATDRFVGFEHVARFLAFVRDSAHNAQLALPGCRAIRRGNRIELTGTASTPFSNSFAFPLSIPGEVILEAQQWAVSAHLAGSDGDPDSQGFEDPDATPTVRARVETHRLALPLAVRSRRPGDWFRPLGLGGRRKKLQDFFVDRKIPRETRDSLPLVVDSKDRIVWVVGHAVAEDFRVTEPSQGVILLKARRLGGEG